MNNLEIYDDFVRLLGKTIHNVALDERDQMLIRMAINHTCLCLTTKEEV
ncbi:hypothetical protein AMI01nite_20170 [Aneurinibacillus migulanus]|nr:hypothetical protein AMI01nite_20170 [Aneurinibacillus migulanus]